MIYIENPNPPYIETYNAFYENTNYGGYLDEDIEFDRSHWLYTDNNITTITDLIITLNGVTECEISLYNPTTKVEFVAISGDVAGWKFDRLRYVSDKRIVKCIIQNPSDGSQINLQINP